MLYVAADGDAPAGMAGGFYPGAETGERNPLDSDPALETIVMTRSP